MLAALALLALLAAGPVSRALAEDDDGDAGWSEQDRARDLLDRGQIQPLDKILAHLAEVRPGEVISVALERKSGRWIYEVKIVAVSGRRIEVEIDAATGSVVEDESE